MKTHLDLFSGIGGFALAARWAGFETVQFVELENYAQRVLTKNFPGVPIHDNIKTFDATKFRGLWLITGGYPCQPFSQAGKRRGEEDDRHLWPEMFRVICEARPAYVLCENVAGHITMGLDTVLSDLEGEGYTCQSFVIPAVAKDAKHRRDRIWILANSNSSTNGTNGGQEREEESIQGVNRQEGCGGLPGGTGSDTEDVAYSQSNDNIKQDGKTDTGRKDVSRWQAEIRPELTGCSQDVAYSESIGWVEGEYEHGNPHEGSTTGRWGVSDSTFRNSESGGSARPLWLPEPSVGRVVDGLPNRMDRLKGLGNAIVPQVAYEIMRCLK